MKFLRTLFGEKQQPQVEPVKRIGIHDKICYVDEIPEDKRPSKDKMDRFERISEKHRNGNIKVIVVSPGNLRAVLSIEGDQLKCYAKGNWGYLGEGEKSVSPYDFMAQYGAAPEVEPQIMRFLQDRGPLPRSLHEPAIS